MTDIPYDVHALRRDFPILNQHVHGQPLVYLDNAATTQKPQVVIDALNHYYANDNANVHRGVHTLSQRATDAHEHARSKVRQWLNARSDKEIIFVRGATEAINLVAQTWGRANLKAGDAVLITAMEHHANIVPWQMLRDQLGIVLKVAPMDTAGELLLDEYAKLLTPEVKLCALSHMSNALGTLNPVKSMIELAHAQGIAVLLDGAQAIPHSVVDVQDLDCEFYVFSGHKLYAPTGIGVLYGKQALLEAMPPYQGGGDMIRRVSFDKTEYAGLPYKFEAGTPHIAGAIGLGVAIDYLQTIGIAAIAAHEHALLTYATERAQEIRSLRIIGTAAHKGGILSFTLGRIHPHDIGTLLDQQGIAIRAGHHCAMPVMEFFGVPATTRASFALYNTFEEVDALLAGVRRVIDWFGE